MMAPALDEIAASDGQRFKITKLNIDEHPELASLYGVRAVPTLLFFKDGQVRDYAVGALSKKAILAKLEALEAAVTKRPSPTPNPTVTSTQPKHTK